MPTFDFYRFRFHFQAVDPVRFPAGRSANRVRGACGIFLRQVAPPEIYARLFEPGRELGPAPSGLGSWPRPFVLRTTELDGIHAAAHEFFHFDLHVFDLRERVLPYFQEAFTQWAEGGVGPGRARTRLHRVEALDLDGHPSPHTPCSISLDPESTAVDEVTLRFVTATELKAGGQLIERPEFAALCARIRDRVCTLRALFGQGPLDVDFRGMAERAAAVTLSHCDLHWEDATRTSSRTGQTHPLGGFTGEAGYQGVLEEFMPWLRAARFTGAGRQTVWGKGEIHILRQFTSGVRNR